MDWIEIIKTFKDIGFFEPPTSTNNYVRPKTPAVINPSKYNRDPFDVLSWDVTIEILSLLDLPSVSAASQVCNYQQHY